jgi:hypothetical protein
MVFIYMYYELFACINLVDVMSLFFMVFSLNRPVSGKNRPEIATLIFGKTVRFIGQTSRFIGETGHISVFPVFTIPRRLWCISAEFS